MARTAKRKALKAWSFAVRARDNHQCVICGKSAHLNAHHILSKAKFSAYALELDNGIAICPMHHQFGKFSAESNGVWFAAWLATNRPQQHQRAHDRLAVEWEKEKFREIEKE